MPRTKTIKARTNRLIALLMLASAASIGSAQAVTLDFDPTSSNASVGDIVSVDLLIGGLNNGGPDSAGSFDLDIQFDNSVVGFNNVQFGSGLGDPDPLSFETINSVLNTGPGIINLSSVSLLFDLSSQASSFVLATLQFDALAVGTSALITSNQLVFDEFANPLNVIANAGSIIITGAATVPSPSSIALLACGAFLYRRNRLRTYWLRSA